MQSLPKRAGSRREHSPDAPALRIEMLGPLRLVVHGRPVPPSAWDRKKTQSLLKLLLTAPGRSFSSGEIIDFLWPKLEPDMAENSLRAAVSKLRRVLEPDLASGRLSHYIATEGEGYAFRCSPDVRMDTEEVESFHRRGQIAQQERRWEDALMLYQSALSRFHGEYLADESDSDWVAPHRERWRDVYQTLLSAKAECHLSLGQYSSVVETCREILRKDPCCEGAYRLQMLSRYLSGHLNDVVTLFRRCRDALQRELEVEPSEETVRLYDQILRKRVSGVDTTPPYPIAVKRDYRVPYSLGRLPFIGREQEVGILASHLDAASKKRGSIVVLAGEPGIGKTRLAEEVLLYAWSRSFLTASGRCYAPGLRRPYEPFTEIFRQILQGPSRGALLSLSPLWLSCAAQIVPGITLHKDGPVLPPVPLGQEKHRLYEALIQLLIGVSEKIPLVLLLDDLHWADDESLEILHDLARRISHERIVVIVLYRLEESALNPLLSQLLVSIQRTSSRALSLSHLPKEAIIELFRKMSAKGEFPGTMEGLALRLHEETQGNPLFVIELLQTLIEKGLLKVNRRGKWTVSVPEDTDRFSWEIPNGIRRVILSRLERIDPEHRRGLGILSTLSRRFTREFLERLLEPEGVAGPIVLDFLLRLGFLQEDPHLKGAYRFAHENIRQTVYDALSASQKKGFHLRAAKALESVSDPDASVSELAHHFLLAEAWPEAFHYLKEATEAARCTFAYGAALSFLDQAEQILSLHGSIFRSPDEKMRQQLRLFRQKDYLLGELGQTKRREKTVAEMVRLARKLGDPIELAGAYLSFSGLHGSNREWERAIDLANQALTLYEAQGEKDGAAKTYRELGYIYWESGEFEKALEANQKALRLHEATGNFRGVAGDLYNLGQIYTSMGNYEKGLEYYRKARWGFRKIGERSEEGRTLNILSRISRLTGNHSEALSNILEALALHREEHDRYGEVHYLLQSASLHLDMGHSEEALASYETALQLSREMGGNVGKEGHALRGLGIIHEQRKNFDRAAACFSDAVALLSEAGDLPSWADVCQRLGDLMVQAFHHGEKALHYYTNALNYYRKEGPSELLRPLLSRAGHACWVSKKPKEAIPLYVEALDLARKQRDRAAEGAALAALSVVYREAGVLKQSLDCALRARALARSLEDRAAEGYVLSSLCDTYVALRRYPKAEEAARAALDCCSGPADPSSAAWAHYRLGRVLSERGKESEGRIHFSKARSLAEKSGDADLLSRIASMKGEVHA